VLIDSNTDPSISVLERFNVLKFGSLGSIFIKSASCKRQESRFNVVTCKSGSEPSSRNLDSLGQPAMLMCDRDANSPKWMEESLCRSCNCNVRI
jgi:hypothetical protein